MHAKPITKLGVQQTKTRLGRKIDGIGKKRLQEWQQMKGRTMKMIDERIALSVPEAAALIGVSKTTMYQIMKRNDVDFALQLGGRRLVSRSKLSAWIDRQTEAKAT